MTIAKRIQMLIALSIVAMLLLGSVGIFSLKMLHQRTSEIADNAVPGILDVATTRASMLRVDGMTKEAIFNTDPTRLGDIEKTVQEYKDKAQNAVAHYEKELVTDEEDRKKITALKSDIAAYLAVQAEVMDRAKLMLSEEAFAIAVQKANPLFAKVTSDVDALFKSNREWAEQAQKQSSAQFSSSLALMIGVFILAVLGQVALGVWLLRSVVAPLNFMKQTMQQVAGGLDFRERVPVMGQDEVAASGRALNDLIGTLQASLKEIQVSANGVGQSAAGMSVSSSEIARSTAIQSDASSAMAASMEQMTVSINHISERTIAASRLTNQSGELAREGASIILSTVDSINRIAEVVRDASGEISRLEESSRNINAVVNVIKEVADQTNLLALNAAIEAARAGEQGRGFAVVADEVRKLAERTSSSTQEIASLVSSIQRGAGDAVSRMGEAVQRVEEGVDRARSAGQAINRIDEGSASVVEIVAEISHAIREQSAASTNVAQQVERIAQMTEENSAAAAGTAEAANQMDSLATNIQQALGRYRV